MTSARVGFLEKDGTVTSVLWVGELTHAGKYLLEKCPNGRKKWWLKWYKSEKHTVRDWPEGEEELRYLWREEKGDWEVSVWEANRWVTRKLNHLIVRVP